MSKDTGNIEITVPGISSWSYEIYTEDQFARFLNYEPAVRTRTGFSLKGKINEKELLKGNYGIFFYRDGASYKKTFSVIPKKVNKYTLP